MTRTAAPLAGSLLGTTVATGQPYRRRSVRSRSPRVKGDRMRTSTGTSSSRSWVYNILNYSRICRSTCAVWHTATVDSVEGFGSAVVRDRNQSASGVARGPMGSPASGAFRCQCFQFRWARIRRRGGPRPTLLMSGTMSRQGMTAISPTWRVVQYCRSGPVPPVGFEPTLNGF